MKRILTAGAVAATLLYGATVARADNQWTGGGPPSTDPGTGTSAQFSWNHDRPQIVMGTRDVGFAHRGTGGGSANNLTYHGGNVVTGVDKVYLVYWGSQWNNNDPSGEAGIQQNFFSHVGGSSLEQLGDAVLPGCGLGDPTLRLLGNPCGESRPVSWAAPGMTTQQPLPLIPPRDSSRQKHRQRQPTSGIPPPPPISTCST